MSAPPDFMARLMAGLQAGLQNPLLNTGIGIMGAAGPSRMPVSIGDALSGGLQQGQQLQAGNLQNQMQQLLMGQNMYGLQALKDAYGNQSNAPVPAAFQQYAPQQVPQSSPQSQPSAQSPQASSGPVTAPASVPMPPNPLMPRPIGTQAPTQQATPQAPIWMQQVAQDTQRLNALSASPMWAKQAEDLRTRMQNTWFPMPPDMIQKYTGAPPEKGYGYFINELGEPKTTGESIYKTGSAPGPTGIPQTFIFDASTGKTTFPGSTASQRIPGTPLVNPADESYAQGLAEYKYKPPSVQSRNSAQAINWLARASELNPAYDENAYDAKHAAYLSMAAGPDYKTNSAYSTVQTHMGTLEDAFNANNNGDTQAANKLIQWSGKQLGKSQPQNLKVVNDIVVGELAKVLAQGGQVTDSVRNEAAGDLEPYLSKGQFSGAIQYIRQLIAGKMATSHLNALANHIPDDVFMAHLSPEARQQLQMFEATHQGQGTSTGGKTLTYDPTMNNGAGGFH